MNKNIKKCIEKLNSIMNHNPLAILFNSNNHTYLYDTGTLKIVRCKEFESFLLEKILNNENIERETLIKKFSLSEDDLENKLMTFCNILETQDLLNVTSKRLFMYPNHHELKKHINSGLRQLILEVTDKCNLRCKYCTYSSDFSDTRNHGDKDMSVDIAFSAIDYLKEHGIEDEVVISFYGGEPLIMIDLIKKCVEYATKTITDKKLTFTATSNLTLMTPELADYISSINNFIIIGSIDGPEDIHDKFRVDINNNGTFNKAINGLKYLVDAFGIDSTKRLLINSVYTPLYSKEKLDSIAQFFNNLEWLPTEIVNMITYPETNSVPLEFYEGTSPSDSIERSLFTWCEQDFVENFLYDEKGKLAFPEVIDGYLTSIYTRGVTNKANFELPLNGCCIPASERIFVSPTGDIRVCEKMLGPEVVGNVTNHIDVKKIEEIYLTNYSNLSLDDCSNCWLAKSCSLCYANFIRNGSYDIKSKKPQCDVTKESYKCALEFYYNCYEKNPNIFEVLYNSVI
ncbi:radical SAM protein [Clostridiaceae bacterium M8S5]|nr:radical SAM protein [Clostridiaceae bacterium M8S5]